MNMRMLPALAALALLAGCAAPKSGPDGITTITPIDQTAKTAVVPGGMDGVLGVLKGALVGDGWLVTISSGAQKVADTQGSAADAKAAAEGQARYTFVVDLSVSAVCSPGQYPTVAYRISVVDNKTGAEVASAKGGGSIKDMGAQMSDLVKHL